MSVEGADILLESSHATSVALILNELVQNAIEHGYGEGADEGTVAIVLHEDPRQIEITVTNDGNLLPDGFDLREADSLGLKIVEELVRGDLNGTFTLANDDGKTRASLVFPK